LHFHIACWSCSWNFKDSLFIIWVVKFLKSNQFEKLQTIIVLCKCFFDLRVVLLYQFKLFFVWIFNYVLLELLDHLNPLFQQVLVLSNFSVVSQNGLLHLFFKSLLMLNFVSGVLSSVGSSFVIAINIWCFIWHRFLILLVLLELHHFEEVVGPKQSIKNNFTYSLSSFIDMRLSLTKLNAEV